MPLKQTQKKGSDGPLASGGVNPWPGPSSNMTEAAWNSLFNRQTSAPLAPDGSSGGLDGGGTDTPSGPDPALVAIAKANAAGKAKSAKENANTAALADQQFALLKSFETQREGKLGNISKVLELANRLLLENFGSALQGLRGSERDNAAAESDDSFANVANAVRERQDILGEVASQGAGETDLMRAQLQALRNYSGNQSEISRSFFDTLRSVENARGALRGDTRTSKANLFQQSEADKEAAWANFYSQSADTATQIMNIENANTNTDSDSEVGYIKKYADIGQKAAEFAAGVYKKADMPDGWTELGGDRASNRQLTSGNRAATVNLGGKQKRPEGATLRKW